MKVVVLGKEYASGTSRKTGKPFAATVVHVAYKKARVDGQTVESIWLDPTENPVDSILVGKAYNVDRDSRGFVLDFSIA